MPLYIGTLANALPLEEIQTTEQAMIQIIEGLRFMHENQILHRDVKPENIFINRASPIHIKLGDLGWATNLQNTKALRGACGTPGFAAPEIPSKMGILSNVVQTTAIDVFSLGGTFYFMIHPEQYKEESLRNILGSVSNQPSGPYAGLTKAMVIHEPMKRISLAQCLDVVRGKLHHWTRKICTDELSSPQTPRFPDLLASPGPFRKMIALQQRPQVQKEIATPIRQTKPNGVENYRQKGIAIATRVGSGHGQIPRTQHLRPCAPPHLRDTNIFATDFLHTRVGNSPGTGGHRSSPPECDGLFGRLHPQMGRGERAHATLTTPIFRPAEPTPPIKIVKLPKKFQMDRPLDKCPQPQKAPLTDQVSQNRDASIESLAISPPTTDRPHQGSTKHRSRRNHEGLNQSRRTTIHDTNDKALRQLRRHPARANMVHRLNAITKRKNQLFHGVKDICRGVGLTAGGLLNTVRGVCGIPYELYSLIFKDVKQANAALDFIAPETGFGLTKERRLAYGLKPKVYQPLTPAEYQAERHKSYFKSPEVKAVLATMSPQDRRLVHANTAENWYAWLNFSQIGHIEGLKAKLPTPEPEPKQVQVTFQEPV